MNTDRKSFLVEPSALVTPRREYQNSIDIPRRYTPLTVPMHWAKPMRYPVPDPMVNHIPANNRGIRNSDPPWQIDVLPRPDCFREYHLPMWDGTIDPPHSSHPIVFHRVQIPRPLHSVYHRQTLDHSKN